MAAKTWAMSDLESVAKNDGFACFPVVLLNRIIREAASTFDASKEAITFSVVQGPTTSNGVARLNAVLLFDAIKLSWGVPGVGVMVEHEGTRFRVRVGAPENKPALGYSFDFGWTEETPVALFPALFQCALESMRERKELK